MFLKYVSILAISVVAADHASAANYDVVVLQDVGGDGDSHANAINAFGEIVGFSGLGAVLWSPNGSGTALQDVGGQGFSAANGINSSGQIVGFSGAGNGLEAVVWSANGVGKALQNVGGGNFTGQPFSIANGINASGQIVGLSETPTGGVGVQWSASTGTGIALQNVVVGSAEGTNDFGQIVGFNGSDAVLWTSATAPGRALQNIGGGGSVAVAINGFGQIVGDSLTFGASALDATLWGFGGNGIALQDVGGASHSEALGINDSGQIVGESQIADGSNEAVLWSTTGAGTSLAGVLGSDWTNTEATAINDEGEIVGFGSFMGSASTAFLLIPRGPIVAIPEPSTWALMLMGFAGLRFLGYRARRARSPAAASSITPQCSAA